MFRVEGFGIRFGFRVKGLGFLLDGSWFVKGDSGKYQQYRV